MTAPDAELATLLAALRAVDSVEALEAAWPGIARQVGRLKDILGRARGRGPLRHTRGHYDPRDGSFVRGEVEVRERPACWQEFRREATEVLGGPVFSDPRAESRRQRLEDLLRRIAAP